MDFFIYLCVFLVWTLGHVAGCPPLFYGMTRNIIADKDITASSHDSDSFPYHARLSNSKGWVPDRNDRNPWIQVNLQSSREIHGIIMGFSDSNVAHYYASFSSDGNDWNNYTEQGKVKVFRFHVYDDIFSTGRFKPSHVAQYIRLYPTNCSNTCALRFDLFVCNSTAGCVPHYHGMPKRSTQDKDITASSHEPHSYPYFAWIPRRNDTSRHRVWVPDQNDSDPWIQVNLQYSKEIFGITTEGPVNRYYVSFSSDGNNWNNYTEQGKVKVFQVFDNISRRVFFIPHVAQYIRLYPTSCSNTCALGFKLYGCNLMPAPTAPRNLKLTVESSTSIKASWTEPLKINGVFKHYMVMYGLSKDGLNTWVYSPTTEYSLAGLNEFTTYYVQVHAETSVSGRTSDIVSARTDEDAPSSAPVINRRETKAEDAHTIRVKWNEIAKGDQNGFILGYAILYKEKGQQSNFSLNAATTNTIIRHLKPYTEYCIQVQGFTKVGKSPLSSCFDVRTLEKGNNVTYKSPVVKEVDNIIVVIASVLGALVIIMIAVIAFLLYQRSNRPLNANLKVESQKKKFELRRSNARVTAVECDQTQENLTLVPVGVTTQLTVSESNERRSSETEESTVVYEEIDLFLSGVKVLSDNGQTPEYTNVSGASSQICSPPQKREDGEHEYVPINQIETPDYMNTYMPLIKGDNPNILVDNSPAYASLLKSEKRSGRR